MMEKHPSAQRGFDDKGWLTSYHSFSFDTYFDPQKMGYHELKVLNEDRLQPGQGIESHSHKEVEIVTLVLEGTLEHQDHLGNVITLCPGDLHVLSAGTGIVHREYNPSSLVPVHFLQLWFNPEQHGLEPSYVQRHFMDAAKWGQWCLLLSHNGRNGSVRIHQDLELYATIIDKGDQLLFSAIQERHYWIQVIKGVFVIGGQEVGQGDALSINEQSEILVRCLEEGELLLLDIP